MSIMLKIQSLYILETTSIFFSYFTKFCLNYRVQLDQTQKELDRVKELYIEVCGTKEQLISEHRNEIRLLKEEYANLESQKEYMDKMKNDLEIQVKIVSRLTKESESNKARIMELEKDLSNERKKKEEYTKKIHEEIEKGA